MQQNIQKRGWSRTTPKTPLQKIAFIGKFGRLHDEEYIARSFEFLGHIVIRIPQSSSPFDIKTTLEKYKPDFLIYTKWICPQIIEQSISKLKREGMKTICWLFDLYFGYHREYLVRNAKYFYSDYLFTTDGGHKIKWIEYGIKHICVRQGIYRDECVLLKNKKKEYDIVFVGSDNPLYPERKLIVESLAKEFSLGWFGRKDTDECRGMDLNELYARSSIVIGNSYYSPHYWSNRVVETLGRGGFLIHQEVEGLKEEYPYLVTYKRGDIEDLKEKIHYYLSHPKERERLRKKNFEWVRDRYTMDKKCNELIQWVNQ